MVKLNWDVSVEKSTKRIGIDIRIGIYIMIGDERGEVIACFSSSLSFSSHPIVAECQALLRALTFCLELGLQRVKLERDALVVIEAINQEAECVACYRDLSEEVKQLLKG